MPLLVATLVGPDRPGLVGVVSDVVRKHGGNWLESRMSHLADQFAGIILIEVSGDDTGALMDALQNLQSEGLKVAIQQNEVSGNATSGTAPLWALNVVGNDRPVIVREVTQVLATYDVNVEELATARGEAPVSGGRIFKAEAKVRLPEGLPTDMLQSELERIATDLMIDYNPE